MRCEYTYIIWDWNGTLLDDVDANLLTAEAMLARRSLPPIEKVERYRKLFSFPVADFYRSVGFDLDSESFDVMAEEYVSEYISHSGLSRLFDDVPRTLRTLYDSGIKMSVLSATEHVRLAGEVASYGIAEYFEHILGVGDNLGKSKIELGRSFTYSISDERVLFVGDCVHDAEVAKCCGADCVLVSRGHMDRERLEATEACVLNNLDELCRLIIK